MPSLTRRVPPPLPLGIIEEPEEEEIGAVVGFCNTLLSQLLPPPPMDACPYAPTVVVAFDCAGPTFRDGLYDAYKAQRGAPPEALGPQFDLAYEACRALLTERERFVSEPKNAGQSGTGIPFPLPPSIRYMAEGFIQKDEPDHRRLRGELVADAPAASVPLCEVAIQVAESQHRAAAGGRRSSMIAV